MNYNKIISLGAVVSLIGYVTSGPLGFIVVRLIKPQPAWASSAVFTENYHIIQDVPFYFGFMLIGGMLMLVSGHYLNYKEDIANNRFLLLVALGCAITFFTLICFNYICQTTFVRHLALNYDERYDAAISMFSMANPLSLCWAIEIWGYGFLGVATWLMAGYYLNRDKLIRSLLVANGVVSIATVIFTVGDTEWLLKPVGLFGYFIWNILMIVLMVLIYRHSKKTGDSGLPSSLNSRT